MKKTIVWIFLIFIMPTVQGKNTSIDYESLPIRRLYENFIKISGAIRRYDINHPEDICIKVDVLVPKFIDKIPKDPWGNYIRYDTRSGFIYSAGPDGKYGDADNIPYMLDNEYWEHKAITKIESASYEDINGNNKPDKGDILEIKFIGQIQQYPASEKIEPENFSLFEFKTGFVPLKIFSDRDIEFLRYTLLKVEEQNLKTIIRYRIQKEFKNSDGILNFGGSKKGLFLNLSPEENIRDMRGFPVMMARENLSILKCNSQ